MNNQEGVARMFGQMMGQVLDDSRQKFELEGLDTAVLAELSKLWKEKLAVAGVSAYMPEQRVEYGGGAAQQRVTDEWGVMPQAGVLGEGAGGILPPGVAIKNDIDQLFQTDGAGAGAAGGQAGAAASGGGGLGLGEFATRKPRRGDLVSLSVGPDGKASGLCIEQVDGAGSGPKKKQRVSEDADLAGMGYGDDGDGGGDEDDLGDEGSELGSDDDDDEEELDTDNLILCQYDKVHRTKMKWKATLKDGLVHVNLPNGTTRDLVFKTAAGDFNFAKSN